MPLLRLDFLSLSLLLAFFFLAFTPPAAQEAGETGEIVFQELDLGEALVIEGRVEKPQVQFPLLMEKPPVNPIRFEMSFRDKMLELTRENVPDFPSRAESAASAVPPAGTSLPPRVTR